MGEEKVNIRIWFTDFWKNFDPEDNWFISFFRLHYNVVLDDCKPDFLIYSKFGNKYLSYNCIRIFYTGENIRPNFWECDYALGFDFYKRNNYYRLPLYGINPELHPEKLLDSKFDMKKNTQKTEFCCFVVSAPNCRKRIEFFKKLSKYKFIHSGGRYLNNIGGAVIDKMDFLQKFKFTIAFENSSYPGYTTEKIFQPMFTDTIPIYWGNPSIEKDFNTKSFINCHEFENDDAVIEYIIQLDNDINLYEKMLNEPWFNNNVVNEYVSRENIKIFFDKIFSSPYIRPIAFSPFHRHFGFINRKIYSYNKVIFKNHG